ncbi:MAG: arylamine N-acetyltransferase [Spirochaetaceae bacterium]|nr:arylamine N-acetyltransferase [Spirochaetaceae bacterium]
MRLEKYFQRIGYQKKPENNLKTLTEIMKLQSRSIAFENLDVHLGKEIEINDDAIRDKLLFHKRGGYCYEVNGLLAQVLKSLGFKVDFLGARTILGYQEKRPITHMILRVDLEGVFYICDLGFTGYNSSCPIPLKSGYYDNGNFMLVKDLNYYKFKTKDSKNNWLSLYSFENIELDQVDFQLANYYNSNSSDSICTQKIICGIEENEKSYRLVNNIFSIKKGESIIKEKIETKARLNEILEKIFGIFLIDDELTILFSVMKERS